MENIRVYCWKPAEGINFGDHIGPMVVSRMLDRCTPGIGVTVVEKGAGKLLAIGSIVQMAEENDHIWGSGVNAKAGVPHRLRGMKVHVHAVRGPITRDLLLRHGIKVPAIFGDPGILFPLLYDSEIQARKAALLDDHRAEGTEPPGKLFIPNLNDERFFFPERENLPDGWTLLSPRNDPVEVAAQISLASLVATSSLHGLVFADAMAKPAILLASRFEPLLKYDDYLLGTGRSQVTPLRTIEVNPVPNVEPMHFDPGPLVRAFPRGLAIPAGAPARTGISNVPADSHSRAVPVTEREIALLLKRLEESEKSGRELGERLKRSEKSLRATRAKLEAVLTSTRWRITAPLGSVVERLSQIRAR